MSFTTPDWNSTPPGDAAGLAAQNAKATRGQTFKLDNMYARSNAANQATIDGGLVSQKMGADVAMAGAFIAGCERAGMTPAQIKEAIDKLEGRFDAVLVDNLKTGFGKIAMEKVAGPPKWLSLAGGSKAMGSAAKSTFAGGSKLMQAAKARPMATLGGAAIGASDANPMNAGMDTYDPRRLFGAAAGAAGGNMVARGNKALGSVPSRSLAGGAMGYFAPGTSEMDFTDPRRLALAAGGAVLGGGAGKQMMTRPFGGQLYNWVGNPANRAAASTGLGWGVDQFGDMTGLYDTGGKGFEYGMMGGAASALPGIRNTGIGRWARNMTSGKGSGLMARATKAAPVAAGGMLATEVIPGGTDSDGNSLSVADRVREAPKVIGNAWDYLKDPAAAQRRAGEVAGDAAIDRGLEYLNQPEGQQQAVEIAKQILPAAMESPEIQQMIAAKMGDVEQEFMAKLNIKTPEDLAKVKGMIGGMLGKDGGGGGMMGQLGGFASQLIDPLITLMGGDPNGFDPMTKMMMLLGGIGILGIGGGMMGGAAGGLGGMIGGLALAYFAPKIMESISGSPTAKAQQHAKPERANELLQHRQPGPYRDDYEFPGQQQQQSMLPPTQTPAYPGGAGYPSRPMP